MNIFMSEFPIHNEFHINKKNSDTRGISKCWQRHHNMIVKVVLGDITKKIPWRTKGTMAEANRKACS